MPNIKLSSTEVETFRYIYGCMWIFFLLNLLPPYLLRLQGNKNNYFYNTIAMLGAPVCFFLPLAISLVHSQHFKRDF